MSGEFDPMTVRKPAKQKPAPAPPDDNSGSEGFGVSAKHLLAFVQRIERLDDEAEALSDDRKDVYGEAGSVGFDKKALKRVVAIRRQDRKNRALRLEHEAIVETYMHALGMIENPNGDD